MISVSNEKNILNPNCLSFDERKNQLDKERQDEINIESNKKRSPYSNWYQFNREYTGEMIWLAGKHPKAHQILLFILDQMDSYNALMCSYKVFQEALNISESTVKRSIKVLKDNGFVKTYKSGTSNVYAVNKKLAWSSWGNNYKYAKFEANIIISESEQEKLAEMSSIEQEKLKQINIKTNIDK